jgi:hypothetical protein
MHFIEPLQLPQCSKPAFSKTLSVKDPRAPEPNGVAERYAGYLNQTPRTMIIDAGLPAFL